MEIFYEEKKPVVFLTNNFDFTVEDIAEIYRLRWDIESLYKQLKLNFPLHFSIEAASRHTNTNLGNPNCYLLITVLSRSTKRHCAFSQVVTMIRPMLMYYVDFIAFMKNPEKLGMISFKKNLQNQAFSIKGAYFGKINPEVLFYGTSGRIFIFFKVLPDSNIFHL